MNRSKIEWCDHTWNVITGCRHGCPYCYARVLTNRFAGNVKQNMSGGSFKKDLENRYELDEAFKGEDGKQIVFPFGFEPTFHRYRLNTLDKFKCGTNVFVGALTDMFGDWVPDEWLMPVFTECLKHPFNNYLFLTKKPARYREVAVLPRGTNFWYGTSITQNTDVGRIRQLPEDRKTFLSIEPLLEPLRMDEMLDAGMGMVDWIIIGAETGNRKGKVTPDFEWIRNIVLTADTAGIPVFMKESLVRVVGEKNMRRDFPPELKIHARSVKLKKRLEDDCIRCGKTGDKKAMVSLTVYVGRRGKVKTLGKICRECYGPWCKENGIEGFEEELFAGREDTGGKG